ncbi:type II toxin-antitoxin system VapC family toxin [Nocardioides mangrovicus]|uniref:Ribonuclease VapC n=1 Tax=Nocardioides mangrovicus TaxID=2478913 RepID=A0A3L8P398_9ACTN|nr:type II toxin-antitoxin system VapC family toxin [Nocardioides mangrovicus]RLV49830.1 type II toxin-antitoxin system VapC family toxin [Nocardioides mangrovicus]
MIVDSSAIVAMARDEPECDVFAAALLGSRARMSAASLAECGIVLDAQGPATRQRLDELLDELQIDVAPFTAEQARIARFAYRRYGKGSGSPARLNLGDCFSYALASVAGEPLLFKGENFTHTDVLPAL